jgi:hypothetical protein
MARLMTVKSWTLEAKLIGHCIDIESSFSLNALRTGARWLTDLKEATGVFAKSRFLAPR